MKEQINLMPPPAKKERIKKIYVKRGKVFYTALLMALGMVGTGYALAYGVFWQSARATAMQLSTIEAKVGSASEETKNVNILLQEAKKQLIEERAWMPDIAEALKKAPASVTVTNVELTEAITNKESSIIISGQSSSRSSTLQFQRSLEELSWVEKVDAPLQNFASGPDVLFKFTLTRKP